MPISLIVFATVGVAVAGYGFYQMRHEEYIDPLIDEWDELEPEAGMNCE